MGWARSTRRLRTRRNGNESDIIKALRQVGAYVKQLDTPADLLVGYRQRWFLLEVKDPSQDPCKQVLTDDEESFASSCAIERLPYSVVKSSMESLKAIGAVY